MIRKAILAVAILAAGSAVQAESRQGTADWRRADRSFADKALLDDRKPPPGAVRVSNKDDCRGLADCVLTGRDKVRYTFFDGRLAEKQIDAEGFTGRFITAFGIGKHRRRADVLRAVALSFPRTRFNCSDRHCIALIGPGRADLIFDAKDMLSLVSLNHGDDS